MVVSEDKKEALVGYYRLLAQPNEAWKRLYLKGLDAEKQYRIEGKNQIKCENCRKTRKLEKK